MRTIKTNIRQATTTQAGINQFVTLDELKNKTGGNKIINPVTLHEYIEHIRQNGNGGGDQGISIETISIGETIMLPMQGGVMREFVVVHGGSPSALYEGFEDGVVVLMKEIWENRQWTGGVSNNNDYAASALRAWLNGAFFNLIDANIRDHIKLVKVPYRPGEGINPGVNSGANGLECRVFLLSGYEVGSGASTYLPADGATFEYFAGIETASANAKRVANLAGSASNWWLRSPSTIAGSLVWFVLADGGMSSGALGSDSHGVRPAFVLPADFKI